jgi:hypothetical protein
MATGICKIQIFAIVAAALHLAGAPAARGDGAIAVGSTGDVVRHGIAFGMMVNDSAKNASTIALERCRKFEARDAAKHCKIVATFSRQCHAVALDPGPGPPGRAAPPSERADGVKIGARGDAVAGKAGGLAALWEPEAAPAVVFTGDLPPGAPAERLTRFGNTWQVVSFGSQRGEPRPVRASFLGIAHLLVHPGGAVERKRPQECVFYRLEMPQRFGRALRVRFQPCELEARAVADVADLGAVAREDRACALCVASPLHPDGAQDFR